MDTPNQGFSMTNKLDQARYCVATDDSGNSVLTGAGTSFRLPKKFTLAEIEVFYVI